MRKIFPFLAFIIIILLTGCHKSTVTQADDTWYIVDNNWILMLCEEAEQENYKGLVTQLKENGDVLNSVIEQLQGMERDAKTENALGVAYLRLRKFNDAERHLKAALDLSVTEEEKACALTNLSECCLFQDKIDEVDRYAEEAYEKDISDPVKRLILDSNMLKKKYMNSEISYKQVIKTAKKLIKQERKLLGSNQAIGVYNYYMIALANYNYVGNDVGVHYMKKALQLNQNTYQYKSVEANLYLEMANYYSNNSEDFDLALKSYNKCIEILENWQTKYHYDLLCAYARRGALYSFISQDQYKAIEDYEKALVQCSSYPELAYSTYIELAWAYENLKQPEQEVKCYARAYYLWQHEGFNDPFGRYKDMLIYAYKNLVETDLDYETWLQEQLKQAEADLKENWGEVRSDENGL